MQTAEQIERRRGQAMVAAVKLAIRTDDPERAAKAWIDAGFVPDTVVLWWRAGCSDPSRAAELRSAGISASRLMSASGAAFGHRHASGDMSTCDVIEALKRYEEYR